MRINSISRFLVGLCAVLMLTVAGTADARPGCVGKMWNPITALDFRLVGGFKIAGYPVMKAPSHLGSPPKHKAPPVCFCENGLQTGFGMGMSFWLPSYINDVARQAGCVGFLGGINVLPSFISLSSGQEYSNHDHARQGVTNMQVHWARADVIQFFGKSLLEKCNVVSGAMSLDYLTEIDFAFQNDVYSALLSPQVAILAKNSLLSQLACGYESIANTLGDWQDMGVCGWKGTRYPLSANAIATKSAQVSNMDVTLKYLTRSAIMGTNLRTIGKDAVCKPKYDAFYDPFQHRYQWSYPGKVSTRFNVDMIRWGLFIKDSGQGSLMSLSDKTTTLSTVNANVPQGTAGGPNAVVMGVVDQVVSKLPKSLNYPTREAGYMQVWEARQCCLIMVTLQTLAETALSSVIPAAGPLRELYDLYKLGSMAYEFVQDPIGGVLGIVGDVIGDALSGVMKPVTDSLKGISDSASNALDGIVDGVKKSLEGITA